MLATALAPRIGHEQAVRVAQEAARTGRTVREVARGLLPEAELDRLLDPRRMTEPGSP
jgi:fumarate hydratase class II